jgi:ketosteroid isomerase-like protein
MTYEVLAVAPDVGVVRWIASHTNEREGRRLRYDGVFVITLTDGLCDSFREWWDSLEEAL